MQKWQQLEVRLRAECRWRHYVVMKRWWRAWAASCAARLDPWVLFHAVVAVTRPVADTRLVSDVPVSAPIISTPQSLHVDYGGRDSMIGTAPRVLI